LLLTGLKIFKSGSLLCVCFWAIYCHPSTT